MAQKAVQGQCNFHQAKTKCHPDLWHWTVLFGAVCFKVWLRTASNSNREDEKYLSYRRAPSSRAFQIDWVHFINIRKCYTSFLDFAFRQCMQGIIMFLASTLVSICSRWQLLPCVHMTKVSWHEVMWVLITFLCKDSKCALCKIVSCIFPIFNFTA